MAWVTEFDSRRLHEIVVELVVELMEHAVSHADDDEALSAFEQKWSSSTWRSSSISIALSATLRPKTRTPEREADRDPGLGVSDPFKNAVHDRWIKPR